MLNSIKETSFIKCNTIKEKEVIRKWIESLGYKNCSSLESIQNNYCIIYPSEGVYQFLSMNPDDDYKQILYSDIIKPNPLSLLENRLRELLLNPNICFKLDTIEEKISMNKLMIELDLRWSSGKNFETQPIYSVMTANKYFTPYNERGSKILSNIENKKILKFKDILKEIGLEELNNKNNNNN